MYFEEDRKIKLISAFSTHKCAWHQPDETPIANLDKHFEPQYPATIYFILSKPRVTVDPKNCKVVGKKITVAINFHVSGQLYPELIELDMSDVEFGDVKLVTQYPYTDFEFVDDEGRKPIKVKAAYFAESDRVYPQIKRKDLVDYKVQYIGQSVLKDTHVPVLDRTETHQAYSQILKDFHRFNPDEEIFLLFLAFRHHTKFEFPKVVDDEHRKIMAPKIADYHLGGNGLEKIRARTRLIESVLIYHFKPAYNDKHTVVSPSLKTKSFKILSDLNLRRCEVYLNFGEDFKLNLFSDAVPRANEFNFHHDF